MTSTDYYEQKDKNVRFAQIIVLGNNIMNWYVSLLKYNVTPTMLQRQQYVVNIYDSIITGQQINS